MANFKIAFQITNGNEGGWQNDPNDPGNASSGLGTYKGIASKKQPGWEGWKTVAAALHAMGLQPAYGSPAYRAFAHQLNSTLAADPGLQSSVEKFYQANFWDVNSLGSFANQELANKVYDSGVNQGTGTAAILLQKALGVMADGSIGPVTIATANKTPGVVEKFKATRIAKYKAIVAVNPSNSQYLDDWISRC